MSTELINDILQIIAVIVLVLANGFFVAAEFALVSVRRTRIAELVSQGNKNAEVAQKALKETDRFIAASQLGITIASLGLGWIGEPALAGLFEALTVNLPESIQSVVSHGLAAAFAFTIITFLHVVAGELAPKTIALQRPEMTTLFIARPMTWIVFIFRPFIWLLNGAGFLLLKLLKVEFESGHQTDLSVAELRMLLRASAESGMVEGNEEVMLNAIFEFGSTMVRQVMVPRTEVSALPADTTLKGVIESFAQTGLSKLPVYEENLDQVIGIVHTKDVLIEMEKGSGGEQRARDMMREAIFVPQSARVDTLLEAFRARRQHIAIVLDEYGGTAGVVTLEDLLEEIVGEVSDPFDTQPDEIEALADGSALIDGLTLIQEVNEHFNIKLADPHYDTIAGFLLGKLGRMARPGDCIIAEGVELRVKTLDGLRVSRVSLTPLPSGPGDAEHDAAE